MSPLQDLEQRIINCEKCSRLVEWREKVAREKVKRFDAWTYWGRPVPGFGDPKASLLIVGLAPAAHGANRTGRIFTGDRSGDWLYRSLHKFGFATQAEARSRDDGLELRDCYVTASLRCAPPQNKPTAEEKNNCFPYLVEELSYLKHVCVVVALGKLAFDNSIKLLRQSGDFEPERKPEFDHGSEARVNSELVLLASYHPSQQNTFTGKLTEPMFDSIFERARELIAANGN